MKNADIVVANTYPATAQAFRARSWIDPALREGGTGVLIVQNPWDLSRCIGSTPGLTATGGTTFFDLMGKQSRTHLARNKGLIVYSQYLTRNMIDSYPPADPIRQ